MGRRPDHPRPAAAGQQLAQPAVAAGLPEGARYRRHRRHRHPPPDPHPAREGLAERLHPRRRRRHRGEGAGTGAQLPRPQGHGPGQGGQLQRDLRVALQRVEPGKRQPPGNPRQRAALPRGGLRLRRQAEHPAHAGGARLPRDRGAGADPGQHRAGDESGRRVPVQRPGRPRAVRLRHPGDQGRAGDRDPGVRHLPRPPAAGPGLRRQDHEDGPRPPRRQPPGAGSGQRRGDDHQPEPRLLRRRDQPAGQPARHPQIAVRRHSARHRAYRQGRLQLPGPPGSQPGPARRGPAVRPLHRRNGQASLSLPTDQRIRVRDHAKTYRH
ncbi:hypothetical protein OF001_U40041 [Pseudomonas sp. OF001]|nr:hypothetical protein OF001_U40041 [Pseudomonas sp. OF001]